MLAKASVVLWVTPTTWVADTKLENMGVSDQLWGLNLPKWKTLKWWIHWDGISASSKRTEAKRCKKNMSILVATKTFLFLRIESEHWRCAWPSSLGEGAFLAHLIRDAVQIWYGFEEASTVSIDLGSKSYLLNYPDHMGIIVTNTLKTWIKLDS